MDSSSASSSSSSSPAEVPASSPPPSTPVIPIAKPVILPPPIQYVKTPYGEGVVCTSRSSCGSSDVVVVELPFGIGYIHKEQISYLATPPPAAGQVWAPLDIPISRRRQTLAVLWWYMAMPVSYLLTLYLLRYSNNLVFYLFLAYLTWMIFICRYHVTGGIKSKAFRELTWWKWFRDFFPIYLHKTVEIPPDSSYVFGYHPHGIISLGAFVNFATEATGFSKLFPGIDLRLLTLTTNFRIPFYHLYLSALGICDASKESCHNILKRGNGNSILLVLGGAKESLDARPNSYDLTLAKRKGFVKVALETHANLVPVIGFGETDVYDQVANPKGSKLRAFQIALQEKLGFALPLVRGRGIFNYSFGILPQRRPIHAVVGAPIILPKLKKEEINSEVIETYHTRYLHALQDLFNHHKALYAPAATLRFVD